MALLVIGAGLAAPSALHGQAQECEWTADHFNNTQVRPNENMTQWQGSVRFECSDGTTLHADNAVRYDWLNEIQFSGNVMFQDSTRTLTADYLNQLGQTNETFARGNVVITDQGSGSVIRGSAMQVWGVSETRTEPLTVIRGRPTAIFHQSSGSAEPPGAMSDTISVTQEAEPVQVVADSMQIVGDVLFRALGRVEIRTGEGQGRSDAADYYQDEDRFKLRGNARFQDRGNTMVGDTLHFWLVDGEPAAFAAHPHASVIADKVEVLGDSIHGELEGGQPRLIRVHGNAVLTGEDVQVDAWRIAIEFEGEQVSVLRAVGRSHAGEPPGGSADMVPDADTLSHLARIRTPEFLLAADSIDANAPGGEIDEVYALGNAYAERIVVPALESTAADGQVAAAADTTGTTPADTTATAPNGGDGESADSAAAPTVNALPEILARDWVRGDTVIAYFTDDTVAAQDSAQYPLDLPEDEGATGSGRVLDRLIASGVDGALASAVYRMVNRAGEPPTIHYVRSSRIELALEGGEIVTADFGNPVHGRSFQPLTASRPVIVEDSGDGDAMSPPVVEDSTPAEVAPPGGQANGEAADAGEAAETRTPPGQTEAGAGETPVGTEATEP